MNLPLSAKVAARYLFAPKSHSAVTAISLISICGIAVATAAIICVLSVFNGFRNILTEKLDTLAPDVAVTPASGKVFADTDSILEIVRGVPGVQVATPVVVDNALIIFHGIEMPVLFKGVVADEYRRITAIDKITMAGGAFATTDSTTKGGTRFVYDDDIGDYVEMPADVRYAADISIGVASRLRALPGSGECMLVFAPRREGRVNLANPAASFERDSVAIAGVFQAMQSDYDKDYVITDIDLARKIFQYDSQCTGIEVKAAPSVSSPALAAAIAERLGTGAVVKDRLQQQELNFRMIAIEKWMAFLLLAFILIVASFNIISTMSMLILDKQSSLGTLHALGASRNRIGAVFAWESVFVTIFGCGAGLILGIGLSLLQQHFGFIKLAGDPSQLVIKAYPVAVQWSDIIVVLIPVAIIGAVTALIAYRFARNRSRTLNRQ